MELDLKILALLGAVLLASTGATASAAVTDRMDKPSTSTTADLQLTEGWNLITVPVDKDYSASSLGQDVPHCDVVARWRTAWGEMESFLVGMSPPSKDFPIKNGRGYFVHVTEDTTFSVTGPQISNVSARLYAGWNSIGWFRESSTTASELSSHLEDTGCGPFVMLSKPLQSRVFIPGQTQPPGFPIDQGMGLFVYTDRSCTWHGQA